MAMLSIENLNWFICTSNFPLRLLLLLSPTLFLPRVPEARKSSCSIMVVETVSPQHSLASPEMSSHSQPFTSVSIHLCPRALMTSGHTRSGDMHWCHYTSHCDTVTTADQSYRGSFYPPRCNFILQQNLVWGQPSVTGRPSLTQLLTGGCSVLS